MNALSHDLYAGPLVLRLRPCKAGVPLERDLMFGASQQLFAHVTAQTAAQSALPVVTYLLQDPWAHYMTSLCAAQFVHTCI